MLDQLQPKVSIIIPHHNNYSILDECLQSLQKINYKNIEIIIVDNYSTDNSIDNISQKYNNLIIQKSAINLGYAGGCNHGSKVASGEYLLFLNNDTTQKSNFIDELVGTLNNNKKIACVQPKIKSYNQKEYFDYAGASGGFIDYLVFPFCRGRIFTTIEKDEGQYNDKRRVFWTSGTAFLTRKKVFKDLGGFDEKLFAHMEEIDYCWKCYLAGYECFVNPKATVYHHGGKTLGYESAYKTYLNHRNSMILLLTNYNLGLSSMLFGCRVILEIISSFNELLRFRIFHFIAHYIALLSLLNIYYLIQRRMFNNKIRTVSDIPLLVENIIYNKSIVNKYYLLRKKTFIDIID